jgi:hypothetical protein
MNIRAIIGGTAITGAAGLGLSACGGSSPAMHEVGGLDFSACTVSFGNQLSATVMDQTSSPVTISIVIINAGGQDSQTDMYPSGDSTYPAHPVTLKPGQSLPMTSELAAGVKVARCTVTQWS